MPKNTYQTVEKPFFCLISLSEFTSQFPANQSPEILLRITRPPSKYDVHLNNTAKNSIQFNNSIGMSDLETREVCSDSTQLDSSYATFYEGHLPRYGRYDIWWFLKRQL